MEMRSISAGKRQSDHGGDDDMVCGLDMCDGLNEYDSCVNDCEGDYTDEVTGVTIVPDDVAKARTGKGGVVRRVQSLRRGDR